MKLPIASSCLVGILLLGGCATAPKKHVPTDKELFAKADKSGDGKVSRAEYQDFMVEQLFAIYDNDGNGLITEEEFVTDGGTAAKFKELNVSGSGKLTLDEAKKSALIMDRFAMPFDEADTSHSGYVTWDEFQVWRAKSKAYNH
ncbi:MAG: EF-hand domain-containing protein [Chthoniobacterales bacterium]